MKKIWVGIEKKNDYKQAQIELGLISLYAIVGVYSLENLAICLLNEK